MSTSRMPSSVARTTLGNIPHTPATKSSLGRDSSTPSLKQEDEASSLHHYPAHDRAGERSAANSVVGDDKDGDDAPIKRKIACMACRNIKVGPGLAS